MSELGRLDIVSANAGICSYGESVDIEEQMWRDVIDTNLTGVWHTAKAAIPHIRAGGRGGAIILTSSAAGLIPYPHLSHYVAAKHGVVGLMKTLALELGPDMIRVNTVNPTTVDTPMVQNQGTYTLFMGGKADATKEEATEAFKTMNVLPIPWVDPVDISNAIVFLASDEARYITGVALPVDAGTVIK
jgi:NAD(P)-dependent dehydrogenase (short-subunit alcohol dehydrogenase family)